MDRGPYPRGRPRVVALGGVRLADLASPFEPLLALWATGYAPFAVTADACTLVAPDE